MLNATEHKICPADKSEITKHLTNSFFLKIAKHENFSTNNYKNANYCWHFLIY